MAEKQTEQPRKTLPPRNNLNRHGLLKNSQGSRLANENPDFVVKAFSLDPRHPSFIGKKLEEHEIGNERSGYAMAPAWEPVSRSTDPKVRRFELRDDEGKNLDTVVRYGRQVYCRMPKAEYERSYAAVERAYQSEVERGFHAPERATFSQDQDGVQGSVTMRSALSRDAGIDVNDLLAKA